MTSEDFVRWRNSQRLSQATAAEKLGISRATIQNYERGTADGKPVEIPKAIRLACMALANGIEEYAASS